MSYSKYEQKAIDLIKSFRDKCLNKNIKNLENFSFWGIDGNKEFGNGLGYSDGDSTRVAYAIYYLLYHSKLPDYSTKFYPNGLSYNYSGDTLCTFNTLFGKTEEIREKVFAILELSDIERKKIINFDSKNNDGDDFYHVYQRIGNFYSLPKYTVKIDNRKYSLNTYRGCFQNDYLDIFLNILSETLRNLNNDSKNIDKSLLEIIRKNSFFFENIKFQEFCDIFSIPEKFDLIGEGLHYAHWILNKNNAMSYKIFAMDYVEKSKQLIEKRSKKMLHDLLEFYSVLKN